MPDDRILTLIELVYAAALDSARWNEVLTALASALSAPCGVLHLQATAARQGSQVLAAIGVDPASQRRYDEHYAHRNIWAVKAQPMLRDGAVLTGQMMCSDQELERSEYYNDYLRSLDFYHSLVAIPAAGNDVSLVVSLLAPKRRGPFDKDDVALLRRLTPHLQQATRVHGRLAQADAERSATAATLEKLPFGVVLLDGAQHIVFVNRAASALASQADGFSLSKDGPAAATYAKTTELRNLIVTAACVERHGAKAGGLITLARPSGRRAFEVLVTPLAATSRMLDGPAALVALFIVDPESAVELPAEALQRLYGFTASEARTASALANGASMDAVAARFHLTNTTTRWVVRQLLEKTGTHSRSEAVALMLRGLASLARQP